VPAWLTGARGFWVANTASLAVAGLGLLLYWRTISVRDVRKVQSSAGARDETP
jgi:MATE family multidrug resistance protein